MSDTKISWADKVWNPLLGCTRVSDGCRSCYAISTAHRWAHSPNEKVAAAFAGLTGHRGGRLDWTGQVNLLRDRIEPLRIRRKPLRWFVNSQADLFHNAVPDDYIAWVFAVIARSPHHTFLVLTKRHARMRALVGSEHFQQLVATQMYEVEKTRRAEGLGPQRPHPKNVWITVRRDNTEAPWWWPLPNLHLGVSVEDQRWADIRIPALLDTPAAVRWISAEPLLGPLDLGPYLDRIERTTRMQNVDDSVTGYERRALGWIVIGGESGPRARPMHPAWARSIRDQALTADIPLWFKQWGPHHPAATPLVVNDDQWVLRYCGTTGETWSFRAGPKDHDVLDGRTWQQLPHERPWREATPTALTALTALTAERAL